MSSSEKYFVGEITVINDLTGKPIETDDVLFTVPSSTITLSLPDDLKVLVFDGESISYSKIYKKFDREVIWDFGDGTIIKGFTATHQYTLAGTYAITCSCLDANGDVYVNRFNKASQAVKVVDIYNTILNFTDSYKQKVTDGLLENVHAGEKVLVGEILSTLGSMIEQDVPIKCYTVKSNTTNIFDLPDKIEYEHLVPFNSFYDEDGEPSLSIMPKYFSTYVHLKEVDDRVKVELYIIDPDGKLSQSDLDQIILNEYITYDYTIQTVKSTDNIPALNYYYIGKVGKVDILYQDDLACDNIELNFVLDQDYFPDTNIKLSKESINLVSIGVNFKTSKNSLDGSEIIFFSTNGLTDAEDTKDSAIYELELSNNSHSSKRACFVGIESPVILRVISNKENPYFEKDIVFESVEVYPENIKPYGSVDMISYGDVYKNGLGTLYSETGSYFCSIKPLAETNQDEEASIIIDVVLRDNSGQKYSYRTTIDKLTFIDIKSFSNSESKYYLEPKQDFIDYSFDEILKAYKTHPMFDETPVLDSYFNSVFKVNDVLQTILNKGWNFVDDLNNINTCSIKCLISLLDSINYKIDLYTTDTFDSPGSLGELLKLLSISHSRLVGTEIKETDEFELWDKAAGKNRGDELKLTDKIYISKNGSERKWPKIICYDKFAGTYTVLNMALIVNDPTAIQEDETGEYFQLIEYCTDWGLCLLVGDMETYKDNVLVEKAGKNISKFYRFYEYIESEETVIENSYLKPETINDRVKSNSTWTKDDGSVDRLLYKAIITSLRLDE